MISVPPTVSPGTVMPSPRNGRGNRVGPRVKTATDMAEEGTRVDPHWQGSTADVGNLQF